MWITTAYLYYSYILELKIIFFIIKFIFNIIYIVYMIIIIYLIDLCWVNEYS